MEKKVLSYVHIRMDPASVDVGAVGGTKVHDQGLVRFALDHSMEARNASDTGSIRRQVNVRKDRAVFR